MKVYGLSEYYVNYDGGANANGRKDKAEETVILLGYANMNEERIKEAAVLLSKAWRLE